LQAAEDGDWENARKEFDAAQDYQDAKQRALEAQRNSATVTKAYERGSKAFNDKKWDEAITQLTIVLNLAPDYKDAGALRQDAEQELENIIEDAQKQIEEGNLDAAIKTLKKAGKFQSADQMAQQMQALKSQLDAEYGKMEKSASDGDWLTALQAAYQIAQAAPNYRNIKEKRDEYHKEIYALSVEAYDAADYAEAIRLLSLLVSSDPNFEGASEKLGAAQAAIKKAKPGIYTINLQAWQDSEDSGLLRDIEVFEDGRIKLNLVGRNNDTRSQEFGCGSNDGKGVTTFLLFASQIKSFPVESLCSQNPGVLEKIEPGGTFEWWWIFPPLEDATQPFDFIMETPWYKEVKDIVLVPLR
jgi:muramidase (phage lysozyme)